MNVPVSGGTGANRSGRRLENFVSEVLEDRDYRYVKPSEFLQEKEKSQPIYTRQFKAGEDIYGKARRVDVILYHPDKCPDCLVIQCKWQASSGSVEQKYPFEVLSTEQNVYDTIIVLDGGGYSQGARQWLLDQVGSDRLKHVFDQGEFSRYARDNL